MQHRIPAKEGARVARTCGTLTVAACLLLAGCANQYGRTVASVRDDRTVDHRTQCEMLHRDATIRASSPHLRHACDLRGYRGPGADLF